MSILKSNGCRFITSGLVYRGVPTLLMDMVCVAKLATDTDIPMSAI